MACCRRKMCQAYSAYSPGPVYPNHYCNPNEYCNFNQYCKPNLPIEDGECTGTLPGGWSSFVKPTANDIAVFRAALQGLIGVIYEPLYVSKQVVSGFNYLFVAKGTIPGPACYTNIFTISVSQALDGTITRGTIQSVKPE